MRIPGIFPIAYSIIFPQLSSYSDSYLTIEDDSLHVLIKNNGDYTQILNYQLEAINLPQRNLNYPYFYFV